MIREDNVFGQVNRDLVWNRKETYFLYGKSYDVELIIDALEDEPFTDLQRESYTEFINKKSYIENRIEEAIYEYYQSVCEEYRERYEEVADIYAPILSDKSQLVEYVTPITILIPNNEEDRTVKLLFNTKWDSEAGIGLKLQNEEVTLVGMQWDVL